MKNILLFIVSLSIFLPLSTLASCITDTPINNQLLVDVLDTDGNPLSKSSRYFIRPAYATMKGGGVRLANLGDQQQNTCPTAVVQSKAVTDNGIAVYFRPENPNLKKIVVNSPVNIKFYLDYSNPCNDLLAWKVDRLGELVPPIGHTISTGAKPDSFRIQPIGNHYKLVFCLHEVCYNIGIVQQSGYHRLILSKDPMVFEFKLHRPIGIAEAC